MGFSVLIHLILLMLFVACGAKKTTSQKFEISFGAMSADRPTMIYGTKSDGSDRFAIKVAGTTVTKDLSNGQWNFQAISWKTATNYMEGDPICAFATAELTGNKTSVNLELKSDSCKEDEWMGNIGWFVSAGNTFFNGFTFNLCSSGTTSALLQGYSDCTGGITGFTGVRVEINESASGSNYTPAISSACYTTSGNTSYTNLKLPFGTQASFPFHVRVKTYYGPSGCTGSACCTGFAENYDFPHGFAQPALSASSAAPISATYTKLKTIERSGNHIAISSASSATYNSCEAVTVSLEDGAGTSISTPSNLTLNLSCSGGCTYHTLATCTDAAISSATITSGSSSSTLYVKAAGYTSKMMISANNWRPAQAEMTTTVTYSTIDHTFLFSAAGVYNISQTYAAPPFTNGQTIVYQTESGNRGKMLINTVTTTSVTGDTLNFDFATYNSSGSLIASGSAQSITACFSGPCSLDLDNSSPVFSGGAGNDFWFENLSGSLYYNPQGTAAAQVLP